MIRITRIDHVSVTVRDTQRALGFYNGLLGLAVSNDRPDLGFPGAWLEIGDSRQIHLLELSSASDEGEDIRAWRQGPSLRADCDRPRCGHQCPG